jgi:hypothetical protein
VACIGAEAYEDALYALRGELPAGWTTFYTAEPDPELHTFLRAERFYGANAEGQTLSAWVDELINGTATDRGEP